MGQKVNPVGFRLKVNRDWDSRWYGEGRQYVTQLHEDRRIRAFVLGYKPLQQASVPRVEIERFPNQIVITLHTARPGIVIGRKGDTVKNLRQEIAKLAKLDPKNVKIDVAEIEKPDTNAQLVAASITDQIERRIGHSRAIKRAIGQAMRQGAQGIRIEVSGRLGGSDMSRREWQSEGRIPRNTLRADVDYGFAEALTTFGRIGVKVWVYNGEVLSNERRQAKTKRTEVQAD